MTNDIYKTRSGVRIINSKCQIDEWAYPFGTRFVIADRQGNMYAASPKIENIGDAVDTANVWPICKESTVISGVGTGFEANSGGTTDTTTTPAGNCPRGDWYTVGVESFFGIPYSTPESRAAATCDPGYTKDELTGRCICDKREHEVPVIGETQQEADKYITHTADGTAQSTFSLEGLVNILPQLIILMVVVNVIGAFRK